MVNLPYFRQEQMPVKNAEFVYNLAAEDALSDVSSSPFYFQIKPPTNWASLKLRELWSYRELVYFLVWRDIKVRYKQTVLGAAWAILQPLFTMAVLVMLLGHVAGDLDAAETPYPLFLFAGLVPWMFFAAAVAAAGNSVVGSQHLITKIY